MPTYTTAKPVKTLFPFYPCHDLGQCQKETLKSKEASFRPPERGSLVVHRRTRGACILPIEAERMLK